MAWSKAYARITWVNEPSTDTPLNATNLNKIDVALNEIDNRVLQLQGSAYVHIKYSAHAAPTNIQMSSIPDVYMGICVTSEETAPTQANAYTWNRVRGEKVVLQSANGYIQWKYENDANWTNIIALTELKGDTGAKGDTGTAATITISETTTSAAGGNASVENIGTSGAAVLKFTIPRGADGDDGREIELQKTATHIQWRYVGGNWSNLVLLSDLKGDTGNTGNTGKGLEYHWDGTQLGIRVEGDQSYTYVDLIGATGATGDTGERGSRWNTGIAITGTSTTPTSYATGITDSIINDWYINPTTSNVYRCTVGGNAATAKWVYSHNQKGADGLGTGDMLKSVYDTNDNGKVDDADKLGGELPTYYAKATDIPSVTGKADKVTGATTGNLAGLDSNGNLTDSGSKPGDFAQASAIPDISGKADKVASAVTGNLASLDSNGNLADSGNKAADFALASAIPDISGKLDKSGGTMTGQLIAQANTSYTAYQVRNMALSTSASLPTGNGALLGVYS